MILHYYNFDEWCCCCRLLKLVPTTVDTRHVQKVKLLAPSLANVNVSRRLHVQEATDLMTIVASVYALALEVQQIPEV